MHEYHFYSYYSRTRYHFASFVRICWQIFQKFLNELSRDESENGCYENGLHFQHKFIALIMTRLIVIAEKES